MEPKVILLSFRGRTRLPRTRPLPPIAISHGRRLQHIPSRRGRLPPDIHQLSSTAHIDVNPLTGLHMASSLRRLHKLRQILLAFRAHPEQSAHKADWYDLTPRLHVATVTYTGFATQDHKSLQHWGV